MRKWRPSDDLSRLLERLGTEILEATDEEVRQLCGDSGYAAPRVAQGVRLVLAAAMDDPPEPERGLSLPDAARRSEPCSRQH